MVRYRRNFLPGGTFFITATLADRKSRVLVDHIGALLTAIRLTRRRYPLGIDAIVVLPEHLHVVMTLPEGDADFSMRWSLIKVGSPARSRRRERRLLGTQVAKLRFGSVDSGSTPSATIAISNGTSTTSITIR